MCCWVAHHRFLLFYPRSASGRSLEGAPPSSRAAGAAGTVVRGWGLAVADRTIRPPDDRVDLPDAERLELLHHLEAKTDRTPFASQHTFCSRVFGLPAAEASVGRHELSPGAGRAYRVGPFALWGCAGRGL